MVAKKTEKSAEIVIDPPRYETMCVMVRGTAPLCIHAFYQKAEIQAKMEAGGSFRKSKEEKAKGVNFEERAERARHLLPDGSDGIHATAFKNAVAEAGLLCAGVKKTTIKRALHIIADGEDMRYGDPLVRLELTEPYETFITATRNSDMQRSPNIAARPRYREWAVRLKVRYEVAQIKRDSVLNLLIRAGEQIGVGEGRPSSPQSCGIGYGTFAVDTESVEIYE